jgi:hypothetical protein
LDLLLVLDKVGEADAKQLQLEGLHNYQCYSVCDLVPENLQKGSVYCPPGYFVTT